MATAMDTSTLPALPLPAHVSSRFVDCKATSGLVVHALTAGTPGKPLILFLHGMVELSYSWRKIIDPIAKHGEGFYCVAPDLRGMGRTQGGGAKLLRHKVDASEFSPANSVRDIVCLVHRLGYTSVHCVVGNDYGSYLSGWISVIRPDMFKANIQISVPFPGNFIPVLGDPAHPDLPPTVKPKVDIPSTLALLEPPRQHYQWSLGAVGAVLDWNNPPQGLDAFVESYLYFKSGSWPGNRPRALEPFTGQNLAQMAPYYVMPIGKKMPEVMLDMRAEDPVGTVDSWFPKPELQAFIAEYARSGFEGMLNYYGASVGGAIDQDSVLFANRPIEIPCFFIMGNMDWAPFLFPGGPKSLENPNVVKPGCFKGVSVVKGSGHYLAQEKPGECAKEICSFLSTL